MFNNDRWSIVKINKAIWDGVVGYGRIEWNYILPAINQKGDNARRLMESFDKVWTRDGTLGTRVGTQVKWKQLPL